MTEEPEQEQEEIPRYSVILTPIEGRDVHLRIKPAVEGVQAWEIATALIRAADHLLNDPGLTFAPTKVEEA